jgi:phage/plasmid-associated DNA primase
MSDPVTGFCNNYIIESHENIEIKQDVIKAFHTYCRNKGFIPLSERKFVEQFKKTVYVRENRLTLYTKSNPEGERFRVWRGVELIGDFDKTQYSIKKMDLVPDVHDVQVSLTQIEKDRKYTGNKSTGHVGQAGHESGDEG